MYTVYLKKNEEKNLFGGYGFVYANEVYKIEGKDKNGSLAKVVSFDGRFIGKGYINHLSKILVRIFIYNDDCDEREIFRSRILAADVLRKTLVGGDNYRAVFGEADLLPGLVVDRYGDVLSVQFLTLGTDMRKQMIVDVLNEIYSPVSIVERSDVAVRKKEGLPETKGVIFGENKTETVIEENGIKMHVDLLNGQKTGYFLDQKFNRFSIRKYVRNKTVLDCFCNVGGFSMNAAIAGAEKVYALDISPVAIKEVEKNAELNGFTVITPILCDVFDKLRVFKTEKKRFGAIVLDPPAFCKDKGQVNSALKGYKDINVLAMKLLEPDGVLFSSSCSHFISTEQFKKMLVESAKESGKIFQITEIRSQGNDHPMLLCNDESSYLKFFILKAVNAKA